MNFKELLRDKQVLNHFKVINDKYIALKDTYVLFPQYYEDKKLAEISTTVTVVGILAIVVDNVYGVMKVLAEITFSPDEVETINIEGESYYRLFFEKGSTMIENTTIVKNDNIAYLVYNCFISGGKIPSFLNYKDMCHVFDSAKEYANSPVGENPEVIELMISLIARDDNDRNIYFRQIADKEDAQKRLCFIPIRSVEYGATNTVNKLGGSRFQIGVVSSIINPTERIENLERILRK